MSQWFVSYFNSAMPPDWQCNNADPPKCGYCYITLVCTPCTGSDIATTGLVNPGDVSFNGQFKGKPFFTTHESEAFKDWATEYKQLLASYGITSYLGQKIIPHQIPLTGDKNFDNLYNIQTANFNPTTIPVDSIPNQNPNVVDLSAKQGVVQLLTTEEEQAKQDEWYKDNFGNLTQMDPNNPAISDVNTGDNGLINEIKGDIIGYIKGEVVTTLAPGAGLHYSIYSFQTNLASGSIGNLQNGYNAIIGTGSYSSVMSSGQLVQSAIIGLCTKCKWISKLF